jgi:hypothetical protein
MDPKHYDFGDLFKKNITVDYISSELKSHRKDTEDWMNNAVKLMEKRGYDVIGIENKDGAIFECLKLDKPDEPCLIRPDEIISDSLPMTELIELFSSSKRKYFFVLKGNEIKDIVTLTDLQKPMFRLYLSGLLSNFEVICIEFIKRFCNDWYSILTDDRKKRLDEFYNKVKNDDENVDKLYYTTFPDKQYILFNYKEKKDLEYHEFEDIYDSRKSREIISKESEKLPKNQVKEVFKNIYTKFRNNIYHPKPIKVVRDPDECGVSERIKITADEFLDTVKKADVIIEIMKEKIEEWNER